MRAARCSTRLVNWKCRLALYARLAVHAVQVVEQIVHGDHVRTRNALRLPEQMRNMQQVAAVLLQNAMQFEIAGDGEFVGLRRER